MNTSISVTEIPLEKIKRSQFCLHWCNIKDRALHIADRFDEQLMRPIVVASRDGTFWCIDGNHRVEAFNIMGKESITAYVFRCVTKEDEGRLVDTLEQMERNAIIKDNKAAISRVKKMKEAI